MGLAISYNKLGDLSTRAISVKPNASWAKASRSSSAWPRQTPPTVKGNGTSPSAINAWGPQQRTRATWVKPNALSEDLKTAERLAKADPTNSQWQRPLHQLRASWGGPVARPARPGEAERLLGEDFKITERLAKADPTNRSGNGTSPSAISLGASAAHAGDLGEAERLKEKPQDLRAPGQGRPHQQSRQRDLSISYMLGLQRLLRDLGEAERLLGESLKIFERLAKGDPANSERHGPCHKLSTLSGGSAALAAISVKPNASWAKASASSSAWPRCRPPTASGNGTSPSATMPGTSAAARKHLGEAERLMGESLYLRAPGKGTPHQQSMAKGACCSPRPR